MKNKIIEFVKNNLGSVTYTYNRDGKEIILPISTVIEYWWKHTKSKDELLKRKERCTSKSINYYDGYSAYQFFDFLCAYISCKVPYTDKKEIEVPVSLKCNKDGDIKIIFNENEFISYNEEHRGINEIFITKETDNEWVKRIIEEVAEFYYVHNYLE